MYKIAEKAAAYAHQHKRLRCDITFNIKNAFNSASWQVILEELRCRRVAKNLINIIGYLSEREIILETDLQIADMKINSGVPQVYVLGLCNRTSCVMVCLRCSYPMMWKLWGLRITLLLLCKHRETKIL